MRLMARKEGILVGPVYTGRALGGLIDLIRKNSFDKRKMCFLCILEILLPCTLIRLI